MAVLGEGTPNRAVRAARPQVERVAAPHRRRTIVPPPTEPIPLVFLCKVDP